MQNGLSNWAGNTFLSEELIAIDPHPNDVSDQGESGCQGFGHI